MGVRVTVVNHADAVLRNALGQMSSFERPLRMCGALMYRSFARQFAASGNPPWLPLSRATVARRRKGSNRPLQDTGRLRRSYAGRSPDSIYNLGKYSLAFGSNVEYAAIHQFGGTISRVTTGGRRLMRRTRNGQYRFMSASSRRYKPVLGVFWSGGRQYSIHIPARPLRVLPEDEQSMREIFLRHVKGGFMR